MKEGKKTVKMSEEEYIQYELASDTRHEYVNGQLIEMPGENALNHQIAMNLAVICSKLKSSGLRSYAHDIKLKVPGGDSYFYADFFLSDESFSLKKYVFSTAVLIMEVMSPTIKKFDAFDKYLLYRQIPELKYYLLVESSKQLIQLFSKTDDHEWHTDFFTLPEEEITLPAIQTSFLVKDLFD